MAISLYVPRLRNDLYCVEWDVKLLYYTIAYYYTLYVPFLIYTAISVQKSHVFPNPSPQVFNIPAKGLPLEFYDAIRVHMALY